MLLGSLNEVRKKTELKHQNYFEYIKINKATKNIYYDSAKQKFQALTLTH